MYHGGMVQNPDPVAHLAQLIRLAVDADQTGVKWALLAWLERISEDAAELAAELLAELSQELEHERSAG